MALDTPAYALLGEPFTAVVAINDIEDSKYRTIRHDESEGGGGRLGRGRGCGEEVSMAGTVPRPGIS